MRSFWLGLALAAIVAGVNVSPAAAQQKDPFGKLVRSISSLFAPATAQAAPAVRIEVAEPANKKSEEDATHAQLKTISVKGKRGETLQTLASGGQGQVVALTGPARYGSAVPSPGDEPTSEVHVFEADGSLAKSWPLEFKGQSVAVGPDGTIFVAGDGKLAKYSVAGKLLTQAEVPHLAEVVKNQAKLKQQAEEQLKQEIESFDETKKTFEAELKKLKEKKGKPTDEESEQIRAYESNIKSYEEIAKSYKSQTVEHVVGQLTSRLRLINAISVTDKDVFIACGELKGHGYAIWRMDLDFTNPKQVLSQLGGCCGQMDVQARGNDLYVAENTRHRVGHYDRDGKLLGSFGKRSRESEGECFGGCCNPMNCRIGPEGEVYTAESEGVVKKWSAKGEYVTTVGVAKLTGGCKNVAVAASPKGDKVYFCDLPGSRIIVLGQKNAAGEVPVNK